MRFNERLIGLLLILLGGIGLLWGTWQRGQHSAQSGVEQEKSATVLAQAGDESQSQRMACRVLTVYDGDTFGCDRNQDGKIQRPKEIVRLLGIDSPEMRYSRKNPTYGSEHPMDEPFGKEASQWLEGKVLQQTVYLEFDKRQYDRYGRALAFVYTHPQAEQSLNEQALSQGHATLLFIGKNRLHEVKMKRAEDDARIAQRGLWAGPTQQAR